MTGPAVSLYYREESDQVSPAHFVLLLSTPPARPALPCTQPLTPGVSNRDSWSLTPQPAGLCQAGLSHSHVT